ncbi:hypothetical protein [Sphingobacterium sp. SGR-19]|uniref:hypothetical protein n=1 Tax=Sphingobacterium sp. SGR-19 TaxID=2710886 RepID=UPI0013ED67EC|nr:hypothetical protein [Sphingobacterium sp. SGR-19]NGM65074.1 hypothetical protein [Sphingobacterium sp. SGR-19]
MKYLVVENSEERVDECLYDIADFFWNNGNQVYISNNYSNEDDYWHFVKYCDWLVLLKYEEWSNVTFFESMQEKLKEDFQLENNSKKLILVFSTNGVYSNIIPFPYKIFHFGKLDQNELKCFFSWCRKLNLFMPKEDKLNFSK